MRTTKIVNKDVEETDDILCNKCGQSLKNCGFEDYGFEGLIEISILFGYGSKQDGTSYKFSLCEDCIMELVKSFKIAPETNEQEFDFYD